MKKYFVIAFALLLYSCGGRKSRAFTYTIQQIVKDTTCNTSCPRFTSDSDGNIVLSYVKEINDTLAYFCYAVSSDNGNRFSAPVEIKETYNVHPHGENLPKLIFKPDGSAIAMWGASNPNPNSKYSGLVYYTQSFDGGNTWTAAIPLVKDTSAYDQRYFDMALLPDGEVMVVWLDNRGEKKEEGSTLFCAVTNGRQGFMNERSIAWTCCPCCRTDLYVDNKGFVHVTFRDIISDSIRDMAHLLSKDGGRNFSDPVRISADNWVINGCPHTGPTITESEDKLNFAWYTLGGEGGLYYCQSVDNGTSFSQRNTVSESHSAKHPQIITMSDGNILIAWDEFVKDENGGSNYVRVQLRTPEGTILTSENVSGPGEKCEFPSIYPVDEKTILISYSRRKDDITQIVWKHVALSLKNETAL